MKLFLVLAALLVAVHSLDRRDRVNGENGWYMPSFVGRGRWEDLEVAEAKLANTNNSEPNGPNEPVNFYLYTKSNPLIGQQITPSTVQSTNFNSRNPTRFIIHGWTANYRDVMNKLITSAWLSEGEFNVICVDWPRAREKDFYKSVKAVPDVGKRVGETIKSLHQENGMSLDTLQVIGHSLGAQIAGFAAKTVGAGQVGTVIGLDPGLPLFRFDKPDQRLSSNDAQFVEILHTNGDNLGFLKPIGKRDLYINGGKRQPVCGIDRNGICSHNLAWKYYSTAVRRGGTFNAFKCPTYERAVDKRCGIRSNTIILGVNTNPELAEGYFYVPLIV